MLFYTGKGDKGISRVGKKTYSKNSSIAEALGELDELNSLLGAVRNELKRKTISKKLLQVQGSLFIIQAQIAASMFPEARSPELTIEKVRELEREIETIERALRPERGFVIPGRNRDSSWLDVARAVSRRVERRLVALHAVQKLSPCILSYMNRLSSYLYALARSAAAEDRVKEQKPTYA